MMNGNHVTITPQLREELGNLKAGGSELLGNGHLAIATQLASFKGARGRGFPYLAHVLPSLTTKTWNGFPLKPWEFVPQDPPMTPEQRQAQNLNRVPQKGIQISYPVMLLVAGAVVFLAVFTITLNASAGASITR